MTITLTVTAGPHEGRVFTFEEHDNFIVGRSKQAHFRLPVKDRYFSRIHFMVEVNPPACRLLDMCARPAGSKVGSWSRRSRALCCCGSWAAAGWGWSTWP